MAKLFLVIGGARSGKTAFAVRQAMNFETRYYLATAQAFDSEMGQRIARHQAERAGQFTTLEEPFIPYEKIPEDTSNAVLIVDCLTLWISNLLMLDYSDERILKEVERLLERISSLKKIAVYLVSNEVGMGIVPENQLSRRFRDLTGFSHQKISQEATEVYQLAFGLPLPLKAISQEFSHDRS